MAQEVLGGSGVSGVKIGDYGVVVIRDTDQSVYYDDDDGTMLIVYYGTPFTSRYTRVSPTQVRLATLEERDEFLNKYLKGAA